jgi:hypothetical protein
MQDDSLSDRRRSPASTAIYTSTSINIKIGNRLAGVYCPTASRGCVTVSPTRRMAEKHDPMGSINLG